MLSAVGVRQQSRRVIRGLFAVFATGLLSVLSVPIPIYATDTTVTAEVRDGQPASLTITTAIDGAIVVLPTVTIEGGVHNVSQIVVYVDNTYNTSIPLPSGASTYIVAFGVTPGTHDVRVVGLDPYTNTEVSQTVSFTYTPGGQAVPGTSAEGEGESTQAPTPVESYVRKTIDAAAATGEDMQSQVQQASSSGPLAGLADITFSAFKSIDMVSMTDGTGVNKMAGRFTLVSAGLAASVFPWSTYSLIQKLRFVPKLNMSTGMLTASMRAIGIALVLIPFLFIH